MTIKEKLKQLAVPLQGLLLIGLCLGLVWMVFITATFDPTPPSILDIQARATQNLSYASMNSTAIALAANMIGELMPSPIVMPVTGNEAGPQPTPTLAVTLRVVAGEVTATPFSIFGFFFDPTATRESRPDGPAATFTAVPTSTPVPTLTSAPTSTPSRTDTPRIPTVTRTATPLPTTMAPPTATRTHTPQPSSTATSEPTENPTETPTSLPPSRTPGPPPTRTEEPPTQEPTATSVPSEEPPAPTQTSSQ